ncbi:hypothetical protein ACRE_087930 [Hapsidospora chrysogenum ATCC 11550]|uniref:ARB-07466-like C-terminal domain-containing protein n=1 Tax=Hapsidospora chrysogenum (strain ATCC 11550 / CBS 779.69 / DSM 880 / IAM 14645 / JCM 23072 / IMI 49137) TaxID=857340 RepID=A0A086STU0_HAPC1|nr:hypothetical protein ACRE_087930 [Hapsidospora chrysogenum ATCC 11550]
MRYSTLLFAAPALATVGYPCYGPDGLAGVCVSDADCAESGGTAIDGACPWDPAGVRCCSKSPCLEDGAASACGWESDCAGTTTPGLCPGGSQVKCCDSLENGYGGYEDPTIPAVGACKQTAVDGAAAVVAEFPGRVREIGCIRDCACGSGSDHCCGMAIDFMIADGGGVATLSGLDIAEWVMNNGASISLKYVIWGQKIWQVSESPMPWSEWEIMEDRGDITQNHWDHVHVSFQ